MIKKYTNPHLLIPLCCMVLFACKKEVAIETKQFGILNLDNQTTYKNIMLNYNGLSGVNLIESANKNIKIPAGTGTLSFYDPSGKSLLETSFSIEAYKTRSLLLFQPSAELKPVILENDQAIEPKPENGFIKIKAANFAPHAFPKPIDIVLYREDPDTFDVVVTDTLKNVTSEFKNFQKLAFLAGPAVAGMDIIDSETKVPLAKTLSTLEVSGKSIFTIYISEDLKTGIPVNNSSYKYSLKTLFAN